MNHANPFAELVRVATGMPIARAVLDLAPAANRSQYRPKGHAKVLVEAILGADEPIDSPRLAKLIDRPASDVLELLAAAERARLVRRTRSARGFYQWESA